MNEEAALSPFLQLVGGELEERGEGYVRFSLELRPHHTNPHGVMHGGVVTTLMDEAAASVIASLRGREAVAAAPHTPVAMSVSFLSAARSGQEVVVEGRALRLGRSVAFAEAEVRRRPGEELIAKGRFTFVILSEEE